MTRNSYLSSGDLSEETIHRTVIEWVCLKPSIQHLVLHFPNEGKRSARYGKLLKDLGLRPGVSDLFVALARHGHHGLWIELKSARGIVSKVQKQFLEDMERQGYGTAICRSIDETITLLDWYCFQK